METVSLNYEVKPLTGADLEWFAEVAATEMLLNELRRPELYNQKQIWFLCEKMMNDGTALVGYKNGEPVGAISGLLIPNLYNPELLTLAELFWYVLPLHRNSRIGAMLLLEFDKLGQRVSYETTISLLKTSPVNLKSLEKRGFEVSELAFRKENTRS